MPGFVRSRFLLPMSDALGRDTRIEDGYVLWEGDELLEVGPYDDAIGARLLAKYGPSLSVLGAPEGAGPPTSVEALVQIEGVVLPGFVKCHGHDHEPPIIGLVKDVPLTRWLDGVVNPFTKFMDDKREALISQLGDSPQLVSYLKARVDDVSYGITTSMVHHCNYAKYYADDLATAATRAGTRMFIAVGSQDRNYYDKLLDIPFAVAIDRLDAYHERWAGEPRVTIVPGPDQLFSNAGELMSAAKAWANAHDTLLHCHSSEEPNTTRWFISEYGSTPVAYAHKLGILDERTVLAHQVHTSDEDLEILAKTGTKIVHNPLANTILGSGMPRILDMLREGVPVAISTDGSGSADNQNIIAAARLASQYQKAFHQDATVLPAQQVLEMITVDAAAILGIPAGSLTPGLAADLIVIDTTRPNLVPTRLTNVVENLIWAANGDEVSHVVAGGEVLREGGDYKTLALDDILAKVTALSTEFDAYRAAGEGELSGTGANR